MVESSAGEAPSFLRLQKTIFIGREIERSVLHRHLDEALSGRGSLVLISGEPGVGKTRLAHEIARDAADHRMRTYLGRCHEVDVGTPYLPFAKILEAADTLTHLSAERIKWGLLLAWGFGLLSYPLIQFLWTTLRQIAHF